jgi:predicted metal-binding protein
MRDHQGALLHICVTCRAGQPLVEGEPVAGKQLHDRVSALIADDAITLRETQCLALCEVGCSAAVSMPGKWSYLLGRLDPSLAGDLLDYVTSYAHSATGAVMPSRRAASLRRAIIGRVPPLERAA